MHNREGRAPVVIELEGPPPDVAGAAPFEDAPLPQSSARATLAVMQGRPRPVLRLLVGAGASFVLLAGGVAAWDFTQGLLTRAPVLGWAAAGLLGLVGLGLGLAAAAEWAGYRRLARLDALRARRGGARRSGRRARCRTRAGQTLPHHPAAR